MPADYRAGDAAGHSALHADLHLSETQIGWLSSLPPMLFAIAAVPGSLLIARVGLIPALLVGLLLTALGGAARGAMPDAAFLFASTIVMAAGVAIMQPILPPLVRAWFPEAHRLCHGGLHHRTSDRRNPPRGAHHPAGAAADRYSWRLSFAVWSIPVLLTALIVAVYAPRLGGCTPRPRPIACGGPIGGGR